MKKTLLSLACAMLATTAFAADTTTTTVTTSSGTVSQYTPGSAFVVKESSGPVTYSYGDDVTYVTKSGTVLKDDEVAKRIRVGVPVSVSYRTEGDKRVISRVELDDD